MINSVMLFCLQPHYKESQVYLARFKQYLSRALNLVKQHVVNTLRTTTKAVLPKLDKPVSLLHYPYSIEKCSCMVTWNIHGYKIIVYMYITFCTSLYVFVCVGYANYFRSHT